MRYSACIVVLHIGVGILSSCERGKPDQPDHFRVALLTPGPISDQSWNGAAYAGLIRIRDSLGATISHVQTKTPAEFEENFRQYGAGGYSLVIGHGFEFQDAAARVGPEFPRTLYLTTGGNTVGTNVAALSFAFEEPSYLAGMVAAATSKSGVIGCIGGMELPPVKSAFGAFSAGALAINPTIKVVVSFLGTWDDAGAGKEQALAQIARGVDVIFQDADAAGLGVFQAAREVRRVRVIGSNANQNAVAPEVTLGSVVIDLPHAFLLVAKEVKERRFRPRVVRLDTRAEAVRWVANPDLLLSIPSATVRAVDSVRALMMRGAFLLSPQR
jgi:basic membrane lipoprotein Med (substrate-binding protein (PBP1-ABC) superfamily)